MTSTPKLGLYERVLSEGLSRQVDALRPHVEPRFERLEASTSAIRLSRYFRDLLAKELSLIEQGEQQVEKQVQLVNRLILYLQRELAQSQSIRAEDPDPLVTSQLLVSLLKADPVTGVVDLPRPSLPLADSHLLINARHEPSIGHELVRELGSANTVDVICSFLLWSGYVQLAPSLRTLMQRPDARIRVITTVYLGATERRVVDELCKLGAEVKISYDTRRTRLHAKAWLLGRESGADTAFVGSSNLSAAAMTSGLEWNVRLGEDAQTVLEKFRAAFEGYWNDPAFEAYEPARDGKRLDEALQSNSSQNSQAGWRYELRPFPFQEAILERLETDRFTHGRFRNLVVAATGTGKTAIAAFDYGNLARRLSEPGRRLPTLLFVAHRRELLEQARDTFRAVLRDSTFGELLVEGERPQSSDFLFASVQSLARLDPTSIDPRRWNVVVIDEFHHAEAPSYERWLKQLDPWVLLGLTATPERADGGDVFRWFGGAATVDIRLWDAIEQGLLAPFQYFALKDPLELSSYWKRGQFDVAALDAVLTGHHARAEAVLRALDEKVMDPSRMRAVGFCVGVSHARFMADYFNARGIRSTTALGGDADRMAKIADLRAGSLQALFTVDALSEGVDIPEMDTALLLRPTESATVFLQQLGRGLRLSEGKRVLTVLDFVATPAHEFRLDRKFRALVGGTRRGLLSQVENDFPFLPAGCTVELSEDAKAVLVENLKRSLSASARTLVPEIAAIGANGSLARILDETGIELGELYRGRCLTQLRRAAGISVDPPGTHEDRLGVALARLRTMDDVELLKEIAQQSLKDEQPALSRAWRMVLSTLVPKSLAETDDAALHLFWQHRALRHELAELFNVLAEQPSYAPIPFDDGRFVVKVHCQYKQEQILCAFADENEPRQQRLQAGVLAKKRLGLDLLFVTINKSLDRYSAKTVYKDFPISRDFFHWQSQGSSRQDRGRGERHVRHKALGIRPLLFVRTEDRDDFGDVAPYIFLGSAECAKFEGERPITITWKLDTPMPAGFFEASRVVVA